MTVLVNGPASRTEKVSMSVLLPHPLSPTVRLSFPSVVSPPDAPRPHPV
jgi:hypothetical protein